MVPTTGLVSQCIPASEGHTYYVGVSRKNSDASGSADCWFMFRTAGCFDNVGDSARFSGGNVSTWQPGYNHDTAPAGTGALYLSCQADNSNVFFDQFFVNVDSLVGF